MFIAIDLDCSQLWSGKLYFCSEQQRLILDKVLSLKCNTCIRAPLFPLTPIPHTTSTKAKKEKKM